MSPKIPESFYPRSLEPLSPSGLISSSESVVNRSVWGFVFSSSRTGTCSSRFMHEKCLLNDGSASHTGQKKGLNGQYNKEKSLRLTYISVSFWVPCDLLKDGSFLVVQIPLQQEARFTMCNGCRRVEKSLQTGKVGPVTHLT